MDCKLPYLLTSDRLKLTLKIINYLSKHVQNVREINTYIPKEIIREGRHNMEVKYFEIPGFIITINETDYDYKEFIIDRFGHEWDNNKVYQFLSNKVTTIYIEDRQRTMELW